MRPRLNPTLSGGIGLVGMLFFYYVLLAVTTGDLLHPYFFFLGKWYLLAPLFIGFGIQMFLFQKLRIMVHESSLKMAGASVGASGLAMAACCAHHLAEIFPLIGFIGAAAVLTEYQDLFLAFGVVMNVGGVIYMRKKIIEHQNMACCAD